MTPTSSSNPLQRLMQHPAFIVVACCLSSALLLASAMLVVVHARQTSAAPIAASSTQSGTLTVYAAGDVARPGVYTLTNGARVQALITLAGGAQTDADLARVNLAAALFDGEEVYVPRIGEANVGTIGTPTGSTIAVNLNLATAATLRQQLHLSSKTANAIIAYRQAHGPFTAVDQLLLVPISQAIYDRIKNQVTV